MIILSTDSKPNPIEVRGIFLGIKLHFDPSKTYDAFKYKFKGPYCKRETFLSSRDKYHYEKLATKYNKHNDVILYSLANIISGKTWIREADENTYLEWTAKMQRLNYTFDEDIKTLHDEAENENIDCFDNVIIPKDANDGKLPLIYRLYQSDKITLETLVILDTICDYTKNLDSKISDPLKIASEISSLIRAYKPFLNSIMKLEKNTATIIKLFTK